MVKKCSWCDEKYGEAWLTHIVVIGITDTSVEAKAFQLCPDCIKLTKTQKGIFLAKTKPGEKVESGNNEPKN